MSSSEVRKRPIVVAAGLLLVLIAFGVWWLTRPPLPGPLRLTRLSFAQLPGWSAGNTAPALEALRRSCGALAAKAAPDPMGGIYAGTVGDWRAPCAAAATAKDARAFFEQWFVPFRVSAGDVPDALFTGYYEPQIAGSPTLHGAFRYPVYDTPGDLISVDLGQFRPSLKGESIAGRLEGHRLVPYPSRADIDARGLKTAHVLFYTDDPIALFFLHIQGSGRVRFDDGRLARVTYAAQNGQVYTAIGRELVARGVPRQGMSLQVIRAWLKSHPQDARQVMESDASYVFFKEEPLGDPALGAKGAEGVALTPRTSIAVDPRLHAFATPFYIATELPGGQAFNRLAVAQDVGGAIRGPARADIFFGVGAEAERLAGGMNHTGLMVALLPKSVAARLKDVTDFPSSPR
ncbi:MAG: MltA domain-containing protein [Alphaproteobacteria bacterium]|nr:MltA domain-containing protein [Alphaproteobacteria bacterium]